MEVQKGEILDSQVDLFDDDQMMKLVWKVGNKEYWKYEQRVENRRLEKEDFYQQGWLAVCSIRNNQRVTDLNYICVAIRNAMFRQVKKSAIVKAPAANKKEEWFYIAGNETRLDSPIGDSEVSLGSTLASEENIELEVERRLLLEQILYKLKDEDVVELERWMNNVPPISRRRRTYLLDRCRKILRGENCYREISDTPSSNIPRVFYDKSKERWIYYEKVKGKRKCLFRSKDKEEVENYARSRQEEFNGTESECDCV